MKLKEGFITHETEGEHITVSAGGSNFSGLIRSNSTAGYIIESLKEETSAEKIIEKMMLEYDAPRDIIEKDVTKIIENLRNIGAIDE